MSVWLSSIPFPQKVFTGLDGGWRTSAKNGQFHFEGSPDNMTLALGVIRGEGDVSAVYFNIARDVRCLVELR